MGSALITGGTSGIGAAFARALAHRGFDLILVARDESRLNEAANELRALGRRVEVLPADLGVRRDLERVAARIEDIDRPVDMVINNAGFGVPIRLSSVDVAEHDRAIDVMVRAVLVLGGAAARAMQSRGQGSIVMVSSVASFVSTGAYSAIKAWVTSYSEALANELHGSGVRVLALCPGWVRTEFHQRAGIQASRIPRVLWLNADSVVEKALADIHRGRVICIPSARYRVLVWFARHLPKSAVREVSRKIASTRPLR